MPAPAGVSPEGLSKTRAQRIASAEPELARRERRALFLYSAAAAARFGSTQLGRGKWQV
jgi:hypothetical protein